MGWAEVAIAIIIAVTISKFAHAKYARTWDDDESEDDSSYRRSFAADAENQRLRDELKSMKDRLAVLERLATDSNDSGARLDREIERLRDRDPK